MRRPGLTVLKFDAVRSIAESTDPKGPVLGRPRYA